MYEKSIESSQTDNLWWDLEKAWKIINVNDTDKQYQEKEWDTVPLEN